MRRRHVVAGALGSLVVLGVLFREPLLETAVLRLTGVRLILDRRFDGWVRQGAVPDELDAALRAIHDPTGEEGPGTWAYELMKPADAHYARAWAAVSVVKPDRAMAEFRMASAFYAIARFPYVSNAAKARAYQRHLECYLTVARHYDPPVEVVRIPFEGKHIIGYLRVPPGEPPPVVVITGGVDTWKGEQDVSMDAMLAEGMAAFAFDMPGTGESAWALAPDADRVYRRAIEYLRARPDLDGDRIGLNLRSMAGYFAVKLAVTDPNVKAAVNWAGPIHLAFSEDHAAQVPPMMVRTILHAMRLPPDTPRAEAVARLGELSLERQGLLRPPERQAALLSINGDRDELVPIEDLYLISKRGIRQEEWVYKGDGHTASGHAAEAIPKAAAWLKAKLGPPFPVAEAATAAPTGGNAVPAAPRL